MERNGALDTSVLLKSLNAIEEIWKWVSDGEETISPSTEEGSDSGEDLMTISIQALSETEGIKTIGLRVISMVRKCSC